ncbi:reverse transcriptase domain-containing protein [Tanacetum coccineum]
MQEVVKKEILKLLDTGIIYPITDSPWVSLIYCIPKKGGITVVINKNDELVPTRTVTGWQVYIDYCKLNEATAKDHFSLPFTDQMRIPFGLCNAPTIFRRCMLAIFHDKIEESVEVFMDNFSVFRDSFDKCLNNLDKMLQSCKDALLVLNWEKCHSMVKERIALGHKVFGAGLEVDKEKNQHFSKIARPLTKLLEKDAPFGFDDECQKAFELLREKLTCAPVIESPNWNLPFKLMCDASDFAVGAVLVCRSDSGSAITIPETAYEFAIKGKDLTLVKGNQFDGRSKTDPHKHIHEFLGICDMFKYIDTKNEAVFLMTFPLSLTGEAKTWLDELNEGTIETWDELRTAFISRFFPPALFD